MDLLRIGSGGHRRSTSTRLAPHGMSTLALRGDRWAAARPTVGLWSVVSGGIKKGVDLFYDAKFCSSQSWLFLGCDGQLGGGAIWIEKLLRSLS